MPTRKPTKKITRPKAPANPEKLTWTPIEWETRSEDGMFWAYVKQTNNERFHAVVGGPRTTVGSGDLGSLERAFEWAEDQMRRG